MLSSDKSNPRANPAARQVLKQRLLDRTPVPLETGFVGLALFAARLFAAFVIAQRSDEVIHGLAARARRLPACANSLPLHLQCPDALLLFANGGSETRQKLLRVAGLAREARRDRGTCPLACVFALPGHELRQTLTRVGNAPVAVREFAQHVLFARLGNAGDGFQTGDSIHGFLKIVNSGCNARQGRKRGQTLFVAHGLSHVLCQETH